jgi:hypothetical protein
MVHVAPDGTGTDHWTGLTAVVALAVGRDHALYALEMMTNSIDEDPFILADTSRLVRQTGPDTVEVVAEGLNFPIRMDAEPDGALYLSLPALGAPAGGGTNARLDLESPATSEAVGTPMAAQPWWAAATSLGGVQCLASIGPITLTTSDRPWCLGRSLVPSRADTAPLWI